jgi:hypothetical protein
LFYSTPLGRTKKRKELEMNGTHSFWYMLMMLNFMGKNINETKKNTEVLLDASEEVDPEVNTEKTKHMSSLAMKLLDKIII